MKKILILGSGGFGKEVLELINEINKQVPTWQVIGFIDKSNHNTFVNGVKVLGDVEYLNEEIKEEVYLVIAIANVKVKERVLGSISNPLIQYPVLIHPSVVKPSDSSCVIGEGSIVCAFNFLSINTRIGRHVLINVMSTVGHDAIINDFCSIMPSVNISGNVTLGKRVYVGVGSKIINDLTISDDVTIGAGSAVLKDVEQNVTVMGVPARIIIKH